MLDLTHTALRNQIIQNGARIRETGYAVKMVQQRGGAGGRGVGGGANPTIMHCSRQIV